MRLLGYIMAFGLMIPTTLAAQERLTPEQERIIFEETKTLSEGEDPAAQYRLAVMYFKGVGTRKDSIESAYWLQRSARQDYRQSISRLAWHYRNGVGVIQNLPEAEKLYKKAYQMGVVGASIPLTAMYRTGEGRTIEEDGLGRVKENHSAAVRWALIASEAGIDRGQNILGELYRDGIGVRQDFGKALEWFEKAAAQDLSLAFFNASVIYRSEDLDYYDPDKGIEYLKLAADKGHAGAMIDLALSYASGSGLQQDYDLALEWYSKAAARNRRSAVKLARAYEDGVFGEPDMARAYKWYYIAQESGEVSGIVGRLAMKERISEAERLAMEREGNQWLTETDG